MSSIDRRGMLRLTAASLASLAAWPLATRGVAQAGVLTKPIPSSGEALPVVGMGTWQTFNVGSDALLREARTQVLRRFFSAGGGLVDSSPMYGSSQAVLGDALDALGRPSRLFAADKVWTPDGDATRDQVASSADSWRLERFDLMQVHNLLSWPEHLETLRAMKAAGAIRYLGVTTSHGRRHAELERVMLAHALDFVQLTYNPIDREAEARLLPLAREKGIAVIANRPFRGGRLIDRLQRSGRPLPELARELGCTTWPELVLKLIVSHPAVTCAIPATTRVEHMDENMSAARGTLPDARTRAQMLTAIGDL